MYRYIGSQANAWNGASVSGGGTSASVAVAYTPFVTAFGNANAATTLTLQVSQDGTNWYDTQVTQVLAGAGNFAISATLGAQYVRLKSSGAATITATIAAKSG